VVVATGFCDRRHVPAVAARLSPSGHQITPSAYQDPAKLPDGGVRVVGAATSGVQLADELARSGREVVLAVPCCSRLGTCAVDVLVEASLRQARVVDGR
jgi:putative flavoprotein involved in K+ transport